MVGGRLVINNPEKSRDAGKYVCVVSNIFGTVRSSEATLSFGCKLFSCQNTEKLWFARNAQCFVLRCILLTCAISVLLCKNRILSALVCRDRHKISL